MRYPDRYVSFARPYWHLQRPCIIRNEQSILPVSSMMHGEYGVEDVCLSTLTLVGPKGISGKIPMRMNKEETKQLQASAEALKSVIAQINL